MNRTKIEWVRNPDGTPGYTWNPITGCLNHTNGMCKGGNFPCYAYRLANTRLRERYLANPNVADIAQRLRSADSSLWDRVATDPFYPRIWMDRILDMTTQRIRHHRRGGRGIFVCDMSDWCGIGIPESWSDWIIEVAKMYPSDRFYLLTKQPQNLIKFSPFPDNCYVGVTATNYHRFSDAFLELSAIEAKIKYVSIEPLLDWTDKMSLPKGVLDWLIIGAQTKPYKPPKIEWVKEIVGAADKAGIPVFLKNNLVPLFARYPDSQKETLYYSGMGLRQEMPK